MMELSFSLTTCKVFSRSWLFAIFIVTCLGVDLLGLISSRALSPPWIWWSFSFRGNLESFQVLLLEASFLLAPLFGTSVTQTWLCWMTLPTSLAAFPFCVLGLAFALELGCFPFPRLPDGRPLVSVSSDLLSSPSRVLFLIAFVEFFISDWLFFTFPSRG